MAKVERIEDSIASGVRAGAVVSTISQAVEELLANSIDAGATFVEIRVDVPCFRLTVSDNGNGIPENKLQGLVGTERASSKARTVEDVNHAGTYGFRGEALHSLGMTSLLEIQSRCRGKDAHGKVIRGGETLHFGPSGTPFQRGTIVTLRDTFYKWPVRRKAMSQAIEVARIKDLVARIALVNSSVAITVVDSARNKTLVKVPSTGSVTRSFERLFSSDKLSMARKLTFDFKQFRLSGYLSPPSSNACHWSKEFQFVYVNRRAVRRLDFFSKTINAAFAPCMAMLSGRGGPDGQAVVKRVRDPNASSGQRQELFPVFLLNVECPLDQVDVLSEPDKTWVEFADWHNSKNAIIAMLLAFLPNFAHAVPGTVLRDLRRAFHKTNTEEMWKVASPPPPSRRASPEPVPTPSPSPLRLGVPDLGSPKVGDQGYAWMGLDGNFGPRAGESMTFEDEDFHAKGVLYRSPATRFGARDNEPGKQSPFSCVRVGGSRGISGTNMSPHFACTSSTEMPELQNGDVFNGAWNARTSAALGFSQASYRSPHFDTQHGRNHCSADDDDWGGREQRPRRLALGKQSLGRGSQRQNRNEENSTNFPMRADDDTVYGRAMQNEEGRFDDPTMAKKQNTIDVNSRIGCHHDAPDELAADAAKNMDSWMSSAGGDVAVAVANERAPGGLEANTPLDDYLRGTLREANNVLDHAVTIDRVQDVCGRGGSSWTDHPIRRHKEERLPSPFQEGLNFGAIHGRLQGALVEEGRPDGHAGGNGRRRRHIGYYPEPEGEHRDVSREGEWLQCLGLAAEEDVVSKDADWKETAVEGVNKGRLSRLFEYAFPSEQRLKSLGHTTASTGETRNLEAIDGDVRRSPGAVKGPHGSDFASGRRITSSGNSSRVSRSPRAWKSCFRPTLPVKSSCRVNSNGHDGQPESFVGVTVRRPPSPQFDFFRSEEARPHGERQPRHTRGDDDPDQQRVSSAAHQERRQPASLPAWAVAEDTHASESVGVVNKELEADVDGGGIPPVMQGLHVPSTSDIDRDCRQLGGQSPSSPTTSQRSTVSHFSGEIEAASVQRSAPTTSGAKHKRRRRRSQAESVIGGTGARTSSAPALRPPIRQTRQDFDPSEVGNVQILSNPGSATGPPTAERMDDLPHRNGVQNGNDAHTPNGEMHERGDARNSADQEDNAAALSAKSWLNGSHGSHREKRALWGTCESRSGNGNPTHDRPVKDDVNETFSEQGGDTHALQAGESDGIDGMRGIAGNADEFEEIEQEQETPSEATRPLDVAVAHDMDREREINNRMDGKRLLLLSEEQPKGDRTLQESGLPHSAERGRISQNDRLHLLAGNEADRCMGSYPSKAGNAPVMEDALEMDASMPQGSFSQTVAEGDSRPNTRSEDIPESEISLKSLDVASTGKSRGEALIRTAMESLRNTRDVALAYDLDVLGGDGLGSHGSGGGGDESDAFGGLDLKTWRVRGATRKGFSPTETCDSCQVSDPGGAAVDSPHEPGGRRARKFGDESNTFSRDSRGKGGGREKPITEVPQAGQDEIGAGAGAVPVTVTPYELGRARVIGQAGRKFILLRAETGAILCVDQHAADERIKLEQFQRQVFGNRGDERNIETLVLEPPETLLITASDAELFEQHATVLSSWCFEIRINQANDDRYGGLSTATLLTVPVVRGVRLSVKDLLGFLHHLRETVRPGASASWLRPPQVQHILNYKACHSAIRFGDLLSRSQCADLIQKLSACKRPFCCAHGRPSVVPLCVLGGAMQLKTICGIDLRVARKRRHTVTGIKSSRLQYHKIKRR